MKSILVVTTRQIGDVLLTTPLIHAARQRWPHAKIDVLGFKGTLGMLRVNPDVNELIETPPRLGWRGVLKLLRQWNRYDLALIAQASDRAHLIGWVLARKRSGIVPAATSSSWLKNALLDHVVVSEGDTSDQHVTQEKLQLLSPWSKNIPAVPAVIAPNPTALPKHLAEMLRPGPVVVHAPSMWAYKQWPVAHYAVLVERLLQQGRQVVLTGTKGARDQECVAPLRALGTAPQLIDATGQLDFAQLTTLFQQSALYIGPDTSISHLAAATGIPMIAIFGPTNPQRWAPWPAGADELTFFVPSALQQQAGNVRMIQGAQSCVPCSRAGCEDHVNSRSDCLISITPERVLAQVEQILGPASA